METIMSEVKTTKFIGSSENKFLVPISQILIESDQPRKIFEDINGLAESIHRFGLIQPIVVDKSKDKEGFFRLIAGERRFRAHMILAMNHGITHVHCNLYSDLDDITRKEIQLEENIRRKNLDPFEEIEAMRQLDEVKRKIHGDAMRGQQSANLPPEVKKGFSQTDLARVVGETQSGVSKKIKLAKELRDNPALKERVKHLPIAHAIRELQRIRTVENVDRLHKEGKLNLSVDIIHGDCIEQLLKLPDESIDLIIIDPPFGIQEIEDSRGETKGGSIYQALLKPDDNATPDGAKRLMELVIAQFSRISKPGAHVYIFHCNEQRQYLTQFLRANNFEHFPDQILIWNKGRTTAPFLGYRFAPCYEPIIFARKTSNNNKRLVEAEKLILNFSPVEDNKKIHPFQKPEELLARLIKLSSNLGDTVLDCFCGSGSTVLAAKYLGRKAIGIEKNHERFLMAQKLLSERTKQ